MEKQQVETLATQLIQSHIPDYTFKWIDKKRTFGACSYTTKTIQLSLTLSLINDYETIKRVIIHEIAHALTKGEGHGYKWRTTCLALGGDGQRCCKIEDTVQIKSRYTLKCDICGTVTPYYRKPKYLDLYYCAKCYKRTGQKTKIKLIID